MSLAVIVDTKHLTTVCRLGEGAACCRYVVASGGGIMCAKHDEIASRLDQYAVSGAMVARGDNCPGYGR